MTARDEKTLNTSRQERYLKAVELLDSAPLVHAAGRGARARGAGG